MKKIFKFPLKLVDEQEISMPAKRQILSVQVQREAITIWALVIPDGPYERVKVEIYGTGAEMKDGPDHSRTHLGTVQLAHLILHVFEVK